jgi:hypothetical protein
MSPRPLRTRRGATRPRLGTRPSLATRTDATRTDATRTDATRTGTRVVAGCAASALAVLALAGCVQADQPEKPGYFETPAASQKAGDGGGSDKGGAATKPAPSNPSDAKAGDSPKVPTSTKIVDVELNGSDDVSVVKGFDAAGHEGVDRYVVSFTKPISGYTLRYVDKLTQDPSDKPVKLQGGALLQLVARGATTDNTPYVAEGTKPTVYSPSMNFKPRMRAISEVRKVGDYEATLSLGIGVKKKLPFRVTLLENPTRLVVDIKQP